MGQPGLAEKGLRGLGVLLALMPGLYFHVTMRSYQDRLVGLLHAQHMQNIAIRIALFLCRPGQLQSPVEYPLPLAALRRQAQVLNAPTHLICIVISGGMTDRKSHAASR